MPSLSKMLSQTLHYCIQYTTRLQMSQFHFASLVTKSSVYKDVSFLSWFALHAIQVIPRIYDMLQKLTFEKYKHASNVTSRYMKMLGTLLMRIHVLMERGECFVLYSTSFCIPNCFGFAQLLAVSILEYAIYSQFWPDCCQFRQKIV